MGRTISNVDLSERLPRLLVNRQIRAGFELLDEFLRAGSFAPAFEAGGTSALFCLAQCIDLGYRSPVSLEELLTGYDGKDRGAMSVTEYLQLRMIEGLSAMRRQKSAYAVTLLDSILQSGDAVLSPYEVFVAQFWLGRAQRLNGDFDASLRSIERAVQLAAAMGKSKLVAVARIHESWLIFHKGDNERALELLNLAEAELESAGHALSLGNISAARGRIIRSSGQYGEALKHFLRAIAIYREEHGEHPNLARAYVNAAYVKRLMALELQPKVRGGVARATTHQRSRRLAEEALDLLAKAAAIYGKQQHGAGIGAVLVNTGYLHLERGDIEQAALTASEAYATGEQHADIVLMARARILQASVELAFCEEQLDELTAPGVHAALAISRGDHAIALAGQTQNRRLLAAAFIVRGLIAADESNLDWALVRSYASQASVLMHPSDKDHLFRELAGLNHRITRSAALDVQLSAWSEGELAGRTFQQVQEDFAALVIPRVWMKLDRKVSRVAQELSISPKKVRRILRAARYLHVPR